jgi:hypothetical protein
MYIPSDGTLPVTLRFFSKEGFNRSTKIVGGNGGKVFNLLLRHHTGRKELGGHPRARSPE